MKLGASWVLSLDEAQPWRAEPCAGLDVAHRGDSWVALHGWLYDLPELASELGTTTRSSPTAVLLDAFNRWGVETPQHLRGTFVFAAAGAGRDTIVARDPLGSHPLFHRRIRGRHVFSESAATLARLHGRPALNRAALADHLCHRWPDAEETFFEEVRRIPCGSIARLTAHGCRIERFWNPAPAEGGIDWIRHGVPERFETAFTRAVDRTLSHGRVAVFLSGGLDSISIAARAADRTRDQRQEQPLLLSLAMDDPDCDERVTQTGVATTLSLPHRLVEFEQAVGGSGLVAPAAELSAELSSPLLNTWAPAYLHLAAGAAGEGVQSVLSGTGGDEWLSVSPYLSADLLARGDFKGWWTFFQAFRRSYRHSQTRHLSLAAWTFGARPLAARAASGILGSPWQARRRRRVTRNDPAWIAPDSGLRRLQLERASGALETPSPPHGFYVREMSSGLHHPLTSWELEEQYEFGKRLSQRFVHPYWDADLVDMLYRATPAALLDGGRAKGLVRGAMMRRFPALALGTQRKVPGTGYFRRLVRDGLPAAAARYGDCRVLAELGVIDRDASRRYASGGFADPMTQWNLVNLEAWVRAQT
ncbi:MAG TPA: asparagine synthase-related protein [Vicinamibacterales bacterium]|nr:asparagine synthase-related protein [Vicinamibacterales bacterium]